MLGSIYVGLSGLDAYSKGLRTISNNVANLNTAGFKSASTEFFNLAGGSGDSAGDPAGSSGNGVGIRDAAATFKQGEIRQTGGNLDVAIQGSGMLVLLPGEKGATGSNTLYTRTGQFRLGDDGWLQDASGRRLGVLQGGTLQALRIDTKRTYPPQATTRLQFADNLSAGASEHTISNVDVFDANGTKTTLTLRLSADFANVAGRWKVVVEDAKGNKLKEDELVFDGNSPKPGKDKITLDLTPAGASPQSVELDFSSGVTGFSAGTFSSLRVLSQDGRAAGNLSAASVTGDGEIKLEYDNGQTQLLGHVALAEFRDTEVLRDVGNGLYANEGTGEPALLASGQGGAGKIVPKSIEASNVDLSAEFGQLILVQRGFQASSQIINASNEMIQQLFDMRGSR